MKIWFIVNMYNSNNINSNLNLCKNIKYKENNLVNTSWLYLQQIGMSFCIRI